MKRLERQYYLWNLQIWKRFSYFREGRIELVRTYFVSRDVVLTYGIKFLIHWLPNIR